jgi:flagella basal body P-ring formation protein FlgA
MVICVAFAAISPALAREPEPEPARPAPASARQAELTEVWVAARRLPKGEPIACADLRAQTRRARGLPRATLSGPCAIAAGSVAMHDLAAGDIVRAADIGPTLDVILGEPVQVTVTGDGVVVRVGAIALADARIGDRVDVRLSRSTSVLKTRVIGRGAVELLD